MTAYGDDPRVHAIRDGRFVCTAGPDAPCRTSPICQGCEVWCGCDGSAEDAADNHDLADGEHCCMVTRQPGQPCWIEPWINAGDLSDCWLGEIDRDVPDPRPADEHGDLGDFPDGPVTVEWEYDYCTWTYAGQPTLSDGGA